MVFITTAFREISYRSGNFWRKLDFKSACLLPAEKIWTLNLSARHCTFLPPSSFSKNLSLVQTTDRNGPTRKPRAGAAEAC